MRRKVIYSLLILILGNLSAYFIYRSVKYKTVPTIRPGIYKVATIAGSGYPASTGSPAARADFSDPFGIAVDGDGNVIIAEGGNANRISRIYRNGYIETIAGGEGGYADGPGDAAKFNTPSCLALNPDGDIIIADTSNNRIRKISSEGIVTTLAGNGIAGHIDGTAESAQFDGPIGVAVEPDGNIIVTDTYNDCIRRITRNGRVLTIAGKGTPGFIDGTGLDAAFDTPCGVAVDKKGRIFVADTGNNAIRRISPDGVVETIAGGIRGYRDEKGTDARFYDPVGIAVTHDGFIFVTDSGGGRVRRIDPDGSVLTIAGAGNGFADGSAEYSRFNGPAGIAIDRDGNIYVADSNNYAIRRITLSEEPSPGNDISENIYIQPGAITHNVNSHPAGLGNFFNNYNGECPWPLEPQTIAREVTGVFGEVRGSTKGNSLDHLHNGIDIRAEKGASVVSIFSEKTSSPVPNWGYGDENEGIEAGIISYIHINLGRDDKGKIQDPGKFKIRYDSNGKVTGVRVRRGTFFKAGDFIGSVNNLNHVHISLGPPGEEINPFVLRFTGLTDTRPPLVERDGIEIVDINGVPFRLKQNNRLVISGDVRIIVTAYDLMDNSASYRKLGLYKCGYQVFKEDGAPASIFIEPLMNIDFKKLPVYRDSVVFTYANGSGVIAYGTPAKYRYIVTNRVCDGDMREGFLRTSLLPRGDYKIIIIAEDFFGNRAAGPSTEIAVSIEQ